MAKVLIRNKKFDVYNREEADSLGIEYIKDWREAQAGQWFLTTDGKVLECIRRNYRKPYEQSYTLADGTVKTRKTKPWYEIVTGYGSTPTYKGELTANKRYSYYWDKPRKAPLTRDVKPTDMQRAFVDYLFMFGELDDTGLWSAESIIKCYQSVYSDNNPKMSLERGLHILKKRRVKEYIMNNMKDELDAIGMNDKFVAQKYKDFLEGEEVSENIRFAALNRISKLRGHDDKDVEQTQESVVLLTDGDRKLLAESRKRLSNQNMDNQLNEFNVKVVDDVKNNDEIEVEEADFGEEEKAG